MKAVAEARTMEKGEDGRPGLPPWLSGPFGWGPKKFAELKTFFSEVRSELKKVTWPGRQEVYSTTIVGDHDHLLRLLPLRPGPPHEPGLYSDLEALT